MTELNSVLEEGATSFQQWLATLMKGRGVTTDAELASRLTEAGFDYSAQDVAELKDGRHEQSGSLVRAVLKSFDLEPREVIALSDYFFITSPHYR